jgi:hypothetical protein
MNDPLNLNDIPRHRKKAIKPSKKRFGIEYRWTKTWRLLRWYPTERKRDQALEDLIRHTCSVLKKPGYEAHYRKVDR